MKKRYRVEFDRRQFLFVGGAASVAPFVVGWTKPNRVAVGTPNTLMKPGDYVWDPGRSPIGEVVIIVSIPEQIVHVYRGGIEIGKATCSTGRKGHATPTGVFVVLEKDINHVSSLYKGAKMPFMERLTWRGVALHAGNLPGYPASHGCIRMPYDFAQLLFGVSHLGVAVIVANDYSEPAELFTQRRFCQGLLLRRLHVSSRKPNPNLCRPNGVIWAGTAQPRLSRAFLISRLLFWRTARSSRKVPCTLKAQVVPLVAMSLFLRVPIVPVLHCVGL